ncbi:sulfotransferase [Luminiphilus sp.]|nr:sulfotransferase [Luminiphilus sp.]
MTEAKQQYRHWLAQSKKQPTDAIAWFNLGWWSAKVGLFAESVQAYEHALTLGIASPEEAMANIASVYSERLGQTAPAGQWLDRALLENPNYYPAIFNRAHIAEQVGDRDTACQYFEQAAALAPEDAYPVARWVEANLTLPPESPAIRSLRRFANNKDPDALMALARYEERAGRYDAAWEALVAANAVDQKAYPPWQALPLQSQLKSQLETIAGKHYLATSKGRRRLPFLSWACSEPGRLYWSSYWPGTRVLRHWVSLNFGPGRFMLWVAAWSPPAECPMRSNATSCVSNGAEAITTDKRPDNLFHMATIRAVLPEAKFIITERDWRDTLVSMLGTRLHPQHGYATSPEGIAQHVAFCREVADFWRENYPKSVYRVNYQALVTNPEKQLKSLLEWLGEAWHPGCLDFHALTNSVRTASVWQVREPVTTSRQGRWRNYDGPLRAIFGDRLDSSEPPA